MEELKAVDPRMLGEYRLLGRLGTGTLSVVYLATSPETDRHPGKLFEIEVLRSEFAGEDRLRNRLARDSKRIMSVAGRRTARVHDVVIEGSSAYLVVEHVEGERLDQLVANGRRIQGPLLWLIADGLVGALREIHAAGIAHLDLRPSNVVIGPAGVKVTGFGLGGVRAEGGFASSTMPEQMSGDPDDARRDIFDLGAVLAFVVLGHHPLQAESAGARGDMSLDDLPSPLRETITRCLAEDPTQRPTTGDLAAIFSSSGTGPITQPIPLVEPVQVSSNPAHPLRPGPEAESRDEVAETRSSSDATPPTLGRVAPVHIGREDVGFHVMEEFSMVDQQYESDRTLRPIRRRRRIYLASAAAGMLAVVATVGVVDVTNVVDLGIIGESAPATTTTTTTSTTSTTTTTVAVTTTLAPPPVHRLYQVNDVNYRWNPCQNPIKILLNPTGKLTPGQQSALEAFLGEQATELGLLTGMTIEYAGLTEDVSGAGYAYGEEILLHIDVPGEGILVDDKPFEGSISGDRIKDGFREIDAVNLQYNANSLQFLFLGDELHSYGRWLVMLMLGSALGLDPLADADMTAAGSTDPNGWEKEVMYYGGRHIDPPTWGPGDRQGLAEVGASAGCF